MNAFRPQSANPDPVRRTIAPAVDRRIGDLAARQHRVVSRRQLGGLGLSDDAIDARMNRGWLRPVYRGVFAVGCHGLDDRGGWMAAVLAAGPHAAALLSHGSAAALHGLLPPRGRQAVEITVAESRRSRPSLRVHRSRVLAYAATVRDGIPCTTVARTLVDVAATGNEIAFERAWSSAASLRQLRPAEVERELGAAPRRAGSALVREALAKDFGYLAQRSRSGYERAALRLCRDFGLPRPHANRLVRIGDRTFEADLLWPGPRLIVEVDGDGTHAHAVARRNDRDRDLVLQLAGWRTIRVGEADLVVDRAATAARLRAALEQPPLEPAPPA